MSGLTLSRARDANGWADDHGITWALIAEFYVAAGRVTVTYDVDRDRDSPWAVCFWFHGRDARWRFLTCMEAESFAANLVRRLGGEVRPL